MILDRIDPAKIVVTDCRYGRMMVLSCDRYMGDALIRTGEYSEAELDLWRELLIPAREAAHAAKVPLIACDIGANIGAHTIPLSGMVDRLYAFEPLAALWRMLVGNLALNGITNTQPMQVAVGDTAGKIQVPMLDYTADDNFGGRALKESHGDGALTYPVPLVRLDDVVAVAHFLKVDVEGMELDVFRGARRIIREYRPILYFECNPDGARADEMGPKQRELISWVQGQGYDCYWHLAPHFSADNLKGVPPKDDHEATVVSFNVLALADGTGRGRIESDPIARIT